MQRLADALMLGSLALYLLTMLTFAVALLVML
ncbi:MAG: hypothetical protein J07HX64_01654 [halophilic archaeon J07HX64]|nr:MAG: hypothetical protein J07HX64_01654 [halophilic archaeon J07HX64]